MDLITEHILDIVEHEKLVTAKQKATWSYTEKKTFNSIHKKAVSINKLNEFLKLNKYEYEYEND